MKLPKVKIPKTASFVKFLGKRFPEILLILILLLICILSLQPGKYILSNDNYSPELNPTLSVSRYLESPAWRGYRVLGFASESEQADVFRSISFLILDIFLPGWSLAQVFSLVSLAIGTISMGFLVKKIYTDYVNKKHLNLVFFVGGLFYLTTLWTAWVFNFNIMPYVTQFGFFPLLLLSVYLLFEKWNLNRILLLIIGSILFTASSVIATLFFVNTVFIIFFTLYFAYLKRIKIKRVLILLGLFLFTQLFWLLPFFKYTLSNSQDIIDSYTNRAITANTIDLEAGMMTFANSARLYTRLLGTVDNPVTQSYIFTMSEDFQAYDIFKFIGLLPFIFSIVGLVFAIVRKKWKLLPLWFLLFALLFLIKNQNAPLGEVYVWLQDNIPLFKQVFRWVSSKLGQPYLITLTISSTIGFFYLLRFFESYFKKRERKLFILIPIILLISCLLFYSEYLFRGQLFTKRALVNLPSVYYSLKQELKNDQTSRIFYAPPANNGYFREYEWGFVGSQFLAYILPNPVMDMSLAIGSDVSEKALLELTNDYNSGDVLQLNLDLEKYDVKYILIDRSLVKGRYGYGLDWNLTDQYAQTWEKIWSQDFLELYKLPEETSTKYVESYGVSQMLERGTFVRKYSQEPVFSPLSVDMSNGYLSKNNLVKEIFYDGVDTTLYSNFKELDIYSLPSQIKRLGTDLLVTPSLPSINGVSNDTYRKFSLPSNSENIYLIGESVFQNDDLLRGVNLYNPWDSLNTVYIVPSTSFEERDLTANFSTTKPGDCSGGDYKVLPDVRAENISSGFSIEGSSKLPCLYNSIKLDKRLKYVIQLSLNWETEKDSILGYCLNSSNAKGCLNKEKFLYTDKGFGDIKITIPTLVYGSDDLSLTLYALNPKGEKSILIIREIKLSYSSEFNALNYISDNIDQNEKVLNIKNGDTLKITIPVMSNGASYIYTYNQKKDLLWQPSTAQASELEYEVASVDGLKQVVEKQYLNQYQELFITNPLKRYLWYWSGINTKNIPSTLCLTYSGDDKCYIDTTFFDDIHSSESRIFSSNGSDNMRMDVSYNSISFNNVTENLLQDFVLMEVPLQWFNFYFKTNSPIEYTEVQARALSASPSSTIYIVNRKDISSRDTLLSIPQAKSQGWVAIGFTNFFFKILPNSSRVYLDGWKQGWDISGMNNLDTIIIFYGPNILSHLGYIVILLLLFIPSFYLFKKTKLWKKITH